MSEPSYPGNGDLVRKAASFREGTKRIYESQGASADMWFFELFHFLGDVQQALDAAPLASAPAQGVWQPIETAPKDGQFLALMHDGREPPNPFPEIIQWNSYGGDKGAWMDGDGGEFHEDAEAKGYCRPLFWMPLPHLALPSTDRGGVA